MAKFDEQDCRLQRIEPAVDANDLVVILTRATMIGDLAGGLVQGLVVCCNCSAVAIRSEVFRREERQGPHRTDVSGGLASVRRSHALCVILDHRKAIGHGH